MSALNWNRARQRDLVRNGSVDRREGFDTDTAARWTKHNGEWAVRAPHNAILAAGSTVTVVTRAGKSKEVRVTELLESTPRAQIWRPA